MGKTDLAVLFTGISGTFLIAACCIKALAASFPDTAGSRIFNRSFLFKYQVDPVGTCQCLGNRHNQICHFNQFHQNLRHIVHQSNGFSLGNSSGIYLLSGNPYNCNNCQINNHISNRIHQSRYFSNKNLNLYQLIIGLFKMLHLIILPAEGPDHTHSGQILSGRPGHLIQLPLYLFIQGHTGCHNTKYHHTQCRNRHSKDHGCPGIYRKCHNHGAKHDKGRTKQKPQSQIQPGLYLVYITGHSCNQSSRSDFILFMVGKAVNMSKQRISQSCGKANRRLCCKELCCQRTGQSNSRQKHQDSSHFQNISRILIPDSYINHPGYYQGNKKFKTGFQHLKQRPQYAFYFIIP